ncbi:MAG: phospho-N-acetylmuramoyl-pentapeptide-transferase [Clostridia bacterium]|nr:phospho-N-acetylmuramoyl-pentapeptide-transferase [Clostridia bacterium]
MFLNCLLAALLALVLMLVMGPFVLPMLHKMKFGQVIREEGPASHMAKQGTPTMGGLMFLAAILVASLLFALDGAQMVLPTLVTMLLFGLVGFLDDFLKIHHHRNLGLRAWQKIFCQVGFAFLISFWAYKSPYIGSSLYLPVSGKSFDLGIWYIPAMMFVILAEVNGVNLTDGLDGLSASVTSVYTLSMGAIFMVLATTAGAAGSSALAANYKGMAVLCTAVVGALMGYLYFNVYPARVFMGDTGSMALGGLVSVLAICSRSVLLLPLMGICFVGSCVSVIIQVGYFKMTHGKRVFRMAPLHHHFELGGMSETRIVCMYTMVTAACCALSLISYFIPRT